MTHPSIDHSGLSPSGRVSKASREAWLKREHDRLFPPGYWDTPEPTEEQQKQAKRAGLLRSAARLREFAANGYRVRYHTKHAERLEREAADL